MVTSQPLGTRPGGCCCVCTRQRKLNLTSSRVKSKGGRRSLATYHSSLISPLIESTAPTQLDMCLPTIPGVQATHSRPPSRHSSLFTANSVDCSIISRGQRVGQLVEPNAHARQNNDPTSRSALDKLDLSFATDIPCTSGTLCPSCSSTLTVLSTTSFVLVEHD